MTGLSRRSMIAGLGARGRSGAGCVGAGGGIVIRDGAGTARGLFHRFATMSGQQVTASGPLNAIARARAFLAEMKVGEGDPDALLTRPAEALVAALRATARVSVSYRSGDIDAGSGAGNIFDGYNPVANVDASFRYKLTPNLELSLERRELTDACRDRYVEVDANRKYEYNHFGRIFLVGVRFKM